MNTKNLNRLTFNPKIEGDLWYNPSTYEVYIIKEDKKIPVELKAKSVNDENKTLNHEELIMNIELEGEIYGDIAEFRSDRVSDYRIKIKKL